MVCPKCKEEFKNGLLFCPSCGAEIRYVPDYNILDEDVLGSLIGEEEQTEETKKDDQPDVPKKRPFPRWLIPVIPLSVAAIMAVVLLLSYSGKGEVEETDTEIEYSYDYYLQHGQVLSREGRYAEALTLIQTALKLNPDSVDAMREAASCYYELKDYEHAEETWLLLIDKTADNAQYFDALISLYEEEGSYDKILALAEKTSRQSTLERIDAYRVEKPVFSEEAGTYEETLHISIDCAEDAYVLYTLDGSDPRDDGIRYEEEIELEDEGEYLLSAAAVGENGIISDVETATYTITYPAPDAPSVSIPSGEYTIEQTVSLNVPAGCSAYFAWDNEGVNRNSEAYTGPIYLPAGTHTLFVICYSASGKASPVASFVYTLYTEAMMTG